MWELIFSLLPKISWVLCLELKAFAHFHINKRTNHISITYKYTPTVEIEDWIFDIINYNWQIFCKACSKSVHIKLTKIPIL